MNKLILLTILLFVGKSLLYKNYPDAIRCGADNSCCDGAVYLYHGAWTTIVGYHQIFSLENRYVYFNLDGAYNSGGGHYDSRKGCQNKTIATLEKQGRTIYFGDSSSNNKIKKLEEEIQAIKKRQTQTKANSKANFWDYEQIKEKWMKEFKKDVLADIKTNGLQIGSRWKLLQQATAFVIRDVEGSKTKDSRTAFPANSLLDPK